MKANEEKALTFTLFLITSFLSSHEEAKANQAYLRERADSSPHAQHASISEEPAAEETPPGDFMNGFASNPSCDPQSSAMKINYSDRQGSGGLVIDEHGLYGAPGSLFIATAGHVVNASGEYEENYSPEREASKTIKLETLAGESFELSTEGAIGVGSGEMVLIPTEKSFGLSPMPLAIGKSTGEFLFAGFPNGEFSIAKGSGTSKHTFSGTDGKRLENPSAYDVGMSGGLALEKKPDGCLAVRGVASGQAEIGNSGEKHASFSPIGI